MKKGFVIVFLVLFSFLLSAQGVKEICIGVNEYAKKLHSAYYEAKVTLNNGEDTLSYLHKVSFQKK
jgi:outer membrane lipoprotein-sorting protein